VFCITFVLGGVLPGCAIEPNPSPVQEKESLPSIDPESDGDDSNIPLGGGDGAGSDDSAENGSGDGEASTDSDVIEAEPDVKSSEDASSTQDSSKNTNSD